MSVLSQLGPEHQAILRQEYPHFSQVEMLRRRHATLDAMRRREVDHLLIHGIGGRGGAVGWLAEWPVTNEAHLVFSPDIEDTLFVQYFNHVPLAQKLATRARVEWAGRLTIATSIAELKRRGARRGRIGVMGPLPLSYARALESEFGEVSDLSAEYARLRRAKSEEELTWFELGARLSDLAIEALGEHVAAGMSERDLGAIVEGAYIPHGGVNGIHYFAVNSMDSPEYCVPRQYPSTRVIQARDVLTTEITANFFEYGGQVLRTFVIGAELTPLYERLHNVAQESFEAIARLLLPGTHVRDLVAASAVIEDAGFTTFDDLVHGYGGGYWSPVLGSPSRPNEDIPDVVLEENMMLVVQPNVVTKDHRAGVQTGECLVVTSEGPRRLHRAPRGVLRVS